MCACVVGCVAVAAADGGAPRRARLRLSLVRRSAAAPLVVGRRPIGFGSSARRLRHRDVALSTVEKSVRAIASLHGKYVTFAETWDTLPPSASLDEITQTLTRIVETCRHRKT